MDVAPANAARTIRGVPTEVPVGSENGLKEHSAVNLHHVVTIPRTGLRRFVGSVPPATMARVRSALLVALGWDD